MKSKLNRRPSKMEWAMDLAQVTAKRSTCCRRAVGCVLLNGRGHVLATGYNGVASGLPHCNELVEETLVTTFGDPQVAMPYMCPGAKSPSGQGLDGCDAIHAEQNALLQCRDVYDIETCVVTTSPCVTCAKLLLNTGCYTIMFLEPYPHSAAGQLWTRAGRRWVNFKQDG